MSETIGMLTIVTSPVACYGRGTIADRPIGRSQPNRLSYFFQSLRLDRPQIQLPGHT